MGWKPILASFYGEGRKSRLLPVRHDLQLLLLAYHDNFDWQAELKVAIFFRTVAGRTGQTTSQHRHLADDETSPETAGLPPHSFRVATATDLLTQGVALEDVQYLAGRADLRRTRLYGRRQKSITRNIVVRIAIRSTLNRERAESYPKAKTP